MIAADQLAAAEEIPQTAVVFPLREFAPFSKGGGSLRLVTILMLGGFSGLQSKTNTKK